MKNILIADARGVNYVKAMTRLGVNCNIAEGSVNEIIENDGLLIPGGDDVDPLLYGQDHMGCRTTDITFDQFEIALCKKFAVANKPVLGICRGAQLINVSFGGTLIQNLPDGIRERHEYHSDLSGEFHNTVVGRCELPRKSTLKGF